MIPGQPIATFDADGDAYDLAGWLIDLIDQSPDKRAIVQAPVDKNTPDDEVDEIEELFRRGYDLAKLDRPDLAFRLLYAQITKTTRPKVLIEVHEHQFAGGFCIRGCGHTQETS